MENHILGKSIAILHRREQKYMIQTMKEYGIGYSGYNFFILFIFKSWQQPKRNVRKYGGG